MRKLIGEELEADQLFWEQDAFQDKDSDGSFSSVAAESDEEDSDIDEEEEQEEAEEEPETLDDVGGRRKRSSKAYVDPAELRKQRLLQAQRGVKRERPDDGEERAKPQGALVSGLARNFAAS